MTNPPRVGPSSEKPSSDLSGFYIYLGPVGAASHVDEDWDSTFGGDLAIVRVRPDATLAALGVDLGGSLWTARGGGRLWLDAIVGTTLGGRMFGITAGSIVELSELAHPRTGGSIGVWTFAGIVPFARVGYVDELGTFGEVGIHLALPVFRN